MIIRALVNEYQGHKEHHKSAEVMLEASHYRGCVTAESVYIPDEIYYGQTTCPECGAMVPIYKNVIKNKKQRKKEKMIIQGRVAEILEPRTGTRN